MTTTATFAYVQVRLQARHGARPDESVWHRLQGTSDFADYLQHARHTPLRPWLATLDPGMDCDAIETELRRLFRRHVDEVTGWVVPAWRPAVRWVRRVPDLPAVRHLLTGAAVPHWLRQDPELRDLGCLPMELRRDVVGMSDCSVLLTAWQTGLSLADAWVARWRTLWPEAARRDRGLEYLAGALLGYLQVLQADTHGSVEERCHALEAQLRGSFRRYSFRPAAVFSHLALTALDLSRLRGDLLVRQLFGTNLGHVA